MTNSEVKKPEGNSYPVTIEGMTDLMVDYRNYHNQVLSKLPDKKEIKSIIEEARGSFWHNVVNSAKYDLTEVLAQAIHKRIMEGINEE